MKKFQTPRTLESKIFYDERGFFFPIETKGWIQSNLSFNEKKFTFRGMHFQETPHEQTKLINVITGSIIDFMIDIRPDSPGFGYAENYLIEPGQSVLVPAGYAHGFLTTSESTLVQYLVDSPYAPSAERCIQWDTVYDIAELVLEEISFDRRKLTINQKDQNSLDFSEFIADLTKKQPRNNKA
jgi:dTDP-4-dehydrorhamnose 3,5-epimerase